MKKVKKESEKKVKKKKWRKSEKGEKEKESENINENLTDVRIDSQPIEKANKRANLIEVTQIRSFFYQENSENNTFRNIKTA